MVGTDQQAPHPDPPLTAAVPPPSRHAWGWGDVSALMPSPALCWSQSPGLGRTVAGLVFQRIFTFTISSSQTNCRKGCQERLSSGGCPRSAPPGHLRVGTSEHRTGRGTRALPRTPPFGRSEDFLGPRLASYRPGRAPDSGGQPLRPAGPAPDRWGALRGRRAPR